MVFTSAGSVTAVLSRGPRRARERRAKEGAKGRQEEVSRGVHLASGRARGRGGCAGAYDILLGQESSGGNEVAEGERAVESTIQHGHHSCSAWRPRRRRISLDSETPVSETGPPDAACVPRAQPGCCFRLSPKRYYAVSVPPRRCNNGGERWDRCFGA